MSEKFEAAVNAAREEKTSYLVIGVSRRDLLSLGSFEDRDEAEKVAASGVIESRFSDTFIVPCEMHFNEQRINWANPDGVRNEPAQGARLNPNEGPQEASPREKRSDQDELSKAEIIRAEAEAQIESGEAIDTGEPDRTLHQRTGGDTNLTSAFDRGTKTEGGSDSEPKPTAKSGVQSSSDVKGTSGASAPKK